MNEGFRILKPFIRGLPIIILIMIISVLVAKKYLTYVTPMYESTAKLKLADIGEGVPNSNLFKNFDVFASSNKIMGEIEVLKSAHLIRKVINTLDFSTEIFRVGDIRTVELYHNSPIIVKLFDPVGEVIDNRYRLLLKSKDEYEIYSKEKKLILKGRINIPETFLDNHIIVSLNNAVISRKKNIKIMDTYEFEFLSDDKLLEKINKNLDIVSVDKDVAVIRINLKSNIPEKAAIFVNRLADVYITDYIDNKYQVANTTVDFLNTQIDEASKKLTMAENKIETYRNQKNITNIQQETETDLRKISQ
ncbi:MAG TPA: Wzz/FepE/Etk N-terminal domain-containing protein, partial [Bacteroidia bacterium]|nr:Wzz/FepE/Etk N-terminal domain-containing protein [Bacteroidia bacterium]